ETVLTLITLLTLVLVLPNTPIDQWNLLNLKKIATMIFALALIQILGSTLSHYVGSKAGAILTGFLGGIVSSTATTATLARQSKVSSQNMSSYETITFLSATGAMLVEAISLLLVGTDKIHPSLFLIFLGPIFATIVMIYFQSRKLDNRNLEIEDSSFKILPILNLSAFIIAILALSKILQNSFGQNGLSVLTFHISLFEIHGSVIANIQLHDSGAFEVQALGNLLAISIVASYVSKLFLIFTLGSSDLWKRTFKCTLILFLSLVLSWTLFVFNN
ncbi:MAG: DUF4010 domain-containing protein, partial [Pseudobdellovibrio sp.]